MTPTMTSSITPARLEQIKALLETTAFRDAQLHPLAGDASFRRYIRVRKDGVSAMLMDAPPEKEDVRPFVAIAEYLNSQGYSAPSVLARNIEAGLLLLEDLGDDSFTMVLKRESGQGVGLSQELYASAIDVLVQWHDQKQEFSKPETLILPSYNNDLLLKEVALFTDWYLPQIMGRDKAESLRSEYMEIWQNILKEAALGQAVWVHRDYHADNLMWLPARQGVKRVGLLDFQDGVYGDPAYDMVSLLEDARRDVPRHLADMMVARYLLGSGAHRERFQLAYAVLGAQRNSKIIGIFSRLAVRDNKFGYLNFMPRVWRHLDNNLSCPIMLPLKKWIDRNVLPEYRGMISVKQNSQEAQLIS